MDMKRRYNGIPGRELTRNTRSLKVTALSKVSPSHIKLKTQVSHKFKDIIDTLLSNDSEIKLFLLNLLNNS